MLADERLLLLEEGHCLRDQALSFCRLVTPGGAGELRRLEPRHHRADGRPGYGITLLPEMAVASEVHRRGDIRLLHFPAPEPKREIGLAWRKTSPRKADFHAFATLLQGCDAPPRQILNARFRARGRVRAAGGRRFAVGDAEGVAEPLGVVAVAWPLGPAETSM